MCKFDNRAYYLLCQALVIINSHIVIGIEPQTHSSQQQSGVAQQCAGYHSFSFNFASGNRRHSSFLFVLHFLPFCKALLIIFLSFCSNPDQSKHLETARMRLFDIWIDFVNLRSEEYAENSRIPSKVYNCSVFWLCTSFTYSAVLTNLHGIFFFCFPLNFFNQSFFFVYFGHIRCYFFSSQLNA